MRETLLWAEGVISDKSSRGGEDCGDTAVFKVVARGLVWPELTRATGCPTTY